MNTFEKLQLKSESFTSKVRMPSIASIAKLLTDLGIKHELYSSVNVVEYRSAGNRYVNSRHNGKVGKKLRIHLSEEERNTVGTYLIELDSSDSYYSWNTTMYAQRIVRLIELRKTQSISK